MVWVKLDDSYPTHPKMVAAGPLGLALQTSAICYSNRYLTDGYIPTKVAKKLLDLDELPGIGWKSIANRLVEVGAWREVPGGYQIHDYAEYQPSKAEVEEGRRAAKERMQRVRANKQRTNSERSGDVRAKFGVRSPDVRSTPSRPVPDVPTERTRAHARDPTPKNQPPVFNGDAHVARLEAEKSDPDTARAEMTRIRRQLNPTTDDADTG
jgi:hypothetical protein